MEKFWDAERRFNGVLREAEQLREMTTAASDLRANENVNFVTRFGFPFALLVNMFAFTFSDWKVLTEPQILGGLRWVGLAAWIGGSAAILLLLLMLSGIQGRRWSRRVREDSKSPGIK